MTPFEVGILAGMEKRAIAIPLWLAGAAAAGAIGNRTMRAAHPGSKNYRIGRRRAPTAQEVYRDTVRRLGPGAATGEPSGFSAWLYNRTRGWQDSPQEHAPGTRNAVGDLGRTLGSLPEAKVERVTQGTSRRP